MMAAQDVLRGSFEPFGLSKYFGIPSLIFWVLGNMAMAIGGEITLFSMRLAHAFFGLAIIGLSYFLLRLAFPFRAALIGTAIIGLSHPLIAISRMAMRDNSALLAAVGAFTILLVGLKRNSVFLAFIGGLVMRNEVLFTKRLAVLFDNLRDGSG